MHARPSSFAALVVIAAAHAGCSGCDDRVTSTNDPSGRASVSVASSPGAPVPVVSSPLPVASVDVGTHASTTWEGGAPVVTGGAIDGAALRARNRERLAHDTSPVVVLHGGSAEELGARLCKDVVPMRPAETPVLLKPNLGGFDWFKDAAAHGGDDGVKWRVTDPEFVRGVVRCLKARGHARITVADGWGGAHKDWERLVRVSGYAEMARQEGVRLVAMDDDGVFDVEDDQPGKPMKVTGMEKTSVPTLLVPKLLATHLERGLFVSLPKLKAHRYAVFSLGIKGMQGTVMLSDASPAHKQKWRMHRELMKYIDAQNKHLPEDRASYVASLEKFAERMEDVLEVEAPDAVLAEGAPAVGGDGFQHFWPLPESVAIGGTNVVRVDRVGAEMLGLWKNESLARELGGHRTSPLLERAAQKLGVDIEAPAVAGDGAALASGPHAVHFVGMAPFAIHSDATPSTSPAAAVASAGPKPVVHAAHIGVGDVTIDGAREAVWDRAEPAIWDTDYAGRKTGVTTRARFLWNERGLYALWELEGAGLHADATRPTDADRLRLYDEDCVEMFLTPDARVPLHYYEVEIGPFRQFLDLEIDRAAHREDVSWSSWPLIAATRDAAARTATIEAALLAPDLRRALAAGAHLPLGLFRMEGQAPARKYLAWSPPRTAKPSFHVPEAFGELVVDP